MKEFIKSVFKGILIFGALILAFVVWRSYENGKKTNDPLEQIKRIQESMSSSESVTKQSQYNWNVKELKDEMTDKSIYSATVRSQNEVVFDFPYEGGSHLIMNIRKRDEKLDVYFKISKGQFVCSEYQGTNNVQIRFDDGEAKSYTTVESSTHDSDIIFIKNSSAIKEIYSKCLTAKSIKVKANFYSEGSRVFTFNVEEPLSAFE